MVRLPGISCIPWGMFAIAYERIMTDFGLRRASGGVKVSLHERSLSWSDSWSDIQLLQCPMVLSLLGDY